MRWVIPVSCSPIFMAGNLAGLRSLDSVICFLFLSSWLLLAHLGVSVNHPKAYLCCSVFRGPFLSPSQSSLVIRTRQAGNNSTSFIVCISGSAPEYSGDMPLFALTLLGYVEVLVTQSCPILCDPMGCSPPGSSVYGIVQAGILEWAAMPSSRGSSWPRDQTWVSCITGRHFTVWATRKVQASNLEAWHAAIHGAQRVGHDLVTEQQIYIYYIHIYALTYILELSFWFIKKFHIHLI